MALVLLLSGHAAAMVSAASGSAASASPVEKVVQLLTQMKEQVEKDADGDKEAFDKYNCWCETNRGLKTEAVVIAEKRITQLESFIEEAAGLEAQLKTEIGSLEEGIAEDQDALRTAAAIREKDMAEFQTAEKDSKESIYALRQAVEVLSKVQFLQRTKGRAAAAEVRPLLLQVKAAVEGVDGKLGAFRGVMQRDLWDVLSSLDEAAGGAAEAMEQQDAPSSDFLSARPGSRRHGRLSALERRGALSAGRQAPPPNALEGNAAGAKSYSARSGSIFGILSEMKDEFEKNLAMDQKQELEALISYHKLKAAKQGEIAAATKAVDEKQATLADTQAKAAQAKEDLETTKDALSADQKFLVGLEKNCKVNEEDFAERAKVRSEELVAIAETIKILTQDDARDLFIKRLSFVQTSAASSGGAGALTDAAQNKAVNTAMKHLLKVARKHKNWILASLAVRVRLDAFTRVKEAMDKMTAELKEQQKAEVEKKDFCNQEIDQTEDSITKKGHEKEDLEGKKLGLENTIASLESELETLKKEIADMHVALKQAGEDRKAENLLFQQSVSDQRATIKILEKAKTRLAMFYAKNATSLEQVHQAPSSPGAEPGAAVEAPPPKPQAYSKSGGGAGVIQLLDKIMQDAARDEAELLKTEQGAQSAYESMAKSTNEAIEVDQTAVVDKTKLMEEASAEKSETAAALLVNEGELAKLDETLNGMHLDCDWLLKYFDVRQQARQEEIEAIAQAKAILSGADFGTQDEV